MKFHNLRKMISEGASHALVESTVSEPISVALGEIEDSWKRMYDEDDPEMTGIDRPSWDRQCEEAIEMLDSILEEAVVDVEFRLFGGEFREE